jgi:ureidoacrylate peracid hydrolase
VGDEIVLDWIRLSAFSGTALDVILRNLGIATVVVTGVWTNMAVEHSVRDAADHAYQVVVVGDATSSINAEWQAVALGYALTNIATIASTVDVTDALVAGGR